MDGAIKLQVLPLSEHNWVTWKFQIKLALKGHGLLHVVENEFVQTNETKAAELEKHAKEDSAAFLIITTNLTQENIMKVMRFETAREAWLELHRIYEGDTDDRAFDLIMTFFKFAKDPADNIGTHLSKLRNVWRDLSLEMKKEGVNELPEIFLMGKTLESCSDEYFQFISSWKLLAKKDRSIEKLTAHLCSYERALQSQGSQDKEEEVLALSGGKGKSKFRKKPAVKVKSKKCKYCGLNNHYVQDCRKWIADGRPIASEEQSTSKPSTSSTKTNCKANMILMSIVEVNSTMKIDKNQWYVDNGATSHVTNRADLFEDFTPFEKNSHTVTTASGQAIFAAGKGSVIVEADVNGQKQLITLKDVWFVPGISKNLFSVLAAQDRLNNSTFVSETRSCKLLVDGEPILLGDRVKKGGLYELRLKNKPSNPIEVNINAVDATDMLQLYHERLVHQSKAHVRKVVEREQGIKIANPTDKIACEGCIYGKAHRLKFGTREGASKPGERIYGDVCGPFVYSIFKYRYFLLLKDDFSKFRYLFLLRKKSEVKDKLVQFIAQVKATGHIIKELFTDNGGEFVNNDVKRILQKEGITHRCTMPHTPQQNSTERENRTVVEAVRAIMHAPGKELPQGLWAEITNTVVYVLNRTGPTNKDKTPHELWYGKKPRIGHLRIIGSTCYAHVPKVSRKKLDKKAKKGILIGYNDDEGYRVWVQNTLTVINSRDVIFEEKTLNPIQKTMETKDGYQSQTERSEENIPKSIVIPLRANNSEDDYADEHQNSEQSNEPTNPMNESVNFDTAESDEENDSSTSDLSHSDIDLQDESEDVLLREDVQDEQPHEASEEEVHNEQCHERVPNRMNLRDRSTIKPPDRFEEFVLNCVEKVYDHEEEPKTFKETLKSADKNKWHSAMDDEMNSLKQNQTWDLVPLPNGRKAISSKWVYKIKRKSDGSIDKYKARLVAVGYSQKKGVDYEKTFSPVAKMSSIRMLLSIAARDNMILTQFDVSTAFLYGSLNEEIYVKQPEGYNDGTSKVCKLKKSLYGLKQAPLCWNNCIKDFLQKQGFIPGEDPCFFSMKRGEGRLLLALYVDDGIIAGTSQALIDKFLEKMKKRFKIKTQSNKKSYYFLGLEIEKEEDCIKIHQGAYTKKVLERFGMQNSKAATTPIVKDSELREEAGGDSAFPYREAVGALAYLMVGTRPDIAYAVGVASRHLEAPNRTDITKVKRIFRYLNGTRDYCITYRKGTQKELVCYSDADHGGDPDSGRSTSGLVCVYGGPISWRSQLQTSVAISSTEAEIVAASEAAREIIWLKRLIENIEQLMKTPVLHIDNESAIKLALNPPYEFHNRTKHIKLRHFFIREAVANGNMKIAKIGTEHQIADMFTKALYKPRLVMLSREIDLHA